MLFCYIFIPTFVRMVYWMKIFIIPEISSISSDFLKHWFHYLDSIFKERLLWDEDLRKNFKN